MLRVVLEKRYFDYVCETSSLSERARPESVFDLRCQADSENRSPSRNISHYSHDAIRSIGI